MPKNLASFVAFVAETLTVHLYASGSRASAPRWTRLFGTL
jgi:hypothetical protein